MRVVGVHLGFYFYFERTVVFSGRRSGRACARGASRQRLWLQHSQTADLSKYNPRSALAVGIASLPVARHRAHRPLHRHPPYRVVVRDQNAPVLVPRQARWAVEARGSRSARLARVDLFRNKRVLGRRGYGNESNDAVSINLFSTGSTRNLCRPRHLYVRTCGSKCTRSSSWLRQPGARSWHRPSCCPPADPPGPMLSGVLRPRQFHTGTRGARWA